jgi:hypothetical protein
VGPRAVLDAVVRRKIPSPHRESNPSIIQPVAQRYTTELSWLPYFCKIHSNISHLFTFRSSKWSLPFRFSHKNCVFMRGMINAYRISVEKPEGKRPLERPKCK